MHTNHSKGEYIVRMPFKASKIKIFSDPREFSRLKEAAFFQF